MADIEGGSIHFGITADDDGFREKLKQDAKAMRDLGNSAGEASDVVSVAFDKIDSSNIKEAKEMLGQLEEEMRHWQQLADSATDAQALEEYSSELEASKMAYEQLNGAISNHERGNKSLRQTYKDIQEQMARLAMAGQKDSDEFRALQAEAGNLKDALLDVGDAAKNAASDTFAIDAAMGAISLGSGVVESVTGLMGALGASTEDAAEMQTKLQSAMALAQGAQQVQLALQKETALMQGIEILKRKANTAAIKVEAAAKNKGVVATKAATVAQKAFNVVANANPYVLLAMALVTVIGAIAAFTLGTSKASEEQKTLNELERIHLEQLQRISEENNRASTERVKALENELNIAKQKANNDKEIRDIEDQIYQEKEGQNAKNRGYYASEIADLESNRDSLAKLKEQLDEVNKAKARGDKKVKVGLELDGNLSKMKVDDAVERLQEKIDQYQSKIDIAVQVKENSAVEAANRKAQLEQRKKEDRERYKTLMKTQEEIKRKEVDNEITLMEEGYEKENALRKEAYERAIKDLKDRLKNESATLTSEAKESINKQIQQQKELYEREQKLADEARAKRKADFQEEIESRYRAMKIQTPEQLRMNISEEYEAKRKSLEREFNASDTSEDRKKEIREEFSVLAVEEMHAQDELDKQIKTQSIANAVEVIQAKIDATREGDEELLKLNQELIDKQLEQDLDAINNNASLTDEQRVNLVEAAKLKSKVAKEDLIRQDEVKQFSNLSRYSSEIVNALGEISDSVDSDALAGLVKVFQKIADLSDQIAENLTVSDGGIGIDWNKLGPDLFVSAAQMTLGLFVDSFTEVQHIKAVSEDWLNTLEKAKYELQDIYSNAFGEDVYKKSIDAAKKATQARDAYNAALANANEKGSYWSNLYGNYGKHEGTRVQLMKAKFGASLQDIAPELFDENGNIKMDYLDSFLEKFGSELNEKTRIYLENLRDLRDATEDLTDELQDYISSTFGGLSDALMESIVNAVESGAESWGDFEDAGKTAIENLIKQMAYSTFLAPIFSQYQDELDKLAEGAGGMSDAQYLQAQMDLMRKYIGALESGARDATNWIRGITESGEFGGLFGGSSEKSVQGAISTVTEQTANIIAGQMNAIRTNQIEANGILRQQLMTLSGIKGDTFYIKKIYDVVSGGAEAYSTRINA